MALLVQWCSCRWWRTWFHASKQTAWLHNLFTLGIGIESMTPLLKEEKSEDKHTIDITAESTVA